MDIIALESIGRRLIIELGYDPDTPGLKETPRRFAHAWLEFMNFDPGNTDTTFESVIADQLVVISGIRVYSMCEHHLLPFWCNISIGYITGQKVLGLSKFARIAQKHAHSLQLQERLVQQIANDVANLAETPSVAVLAAGYHLCMIMRGVKTGGQMTSSVMLGNFREDRALRQEFLSIVNHQQEMNFS